MGFDPDLVTLAQARTWLREHLDEGTRCPCCDQHAQIYRWSLYRTAVRTLLGLWRSGGTELFVESKTVKTPGQGGDMTRLGHWELVEHEPDRRPDGGKSGWWRVTPKGEEFIRGRLPVEKYAYVYDGACLRRDGPPRLIYDLLGYQFNWREHMYRLDEDDT